jgi:hypothetical protein
VASARGRQRGAADQFGTSQHQLLRDVRTHRGANDSNRSDIEFLAIVVAEFAKSSPRCDELVSLTKRTLTAASRDIRFGVVREGTRKR